MIAIDAAEEALGGPWVIALKHWKLILGGVGLAVLGTMLMLAKADARHWQKLDAQHKQLAVNAVHAANTNLASVNTLLGVVGMQNAQSLARAKSYDDSKVEDAKNRAASDEREKASIAQRARLQGIADHAAANPSCAAPKALTDGLAGL